MKKTTKRALSFLLTLVMLVSTMSVGFFGITSLAATNATVDSAHQAVIAVPETVYMTPKNGASTTGQYYVNNTISGYTVVPEVSPNNTKGYVQLYIPGAKSVTYSVNYCSGTNVGAVTVTNEETAKTFTDDYVKLNETTISVGTGLNPGETSLVEWKFTVTMNDGSSRVYYAYTTLYAPYINPVGSAILLEGRYYSNNKLFASSMAWVSGVHGFTNDPAANAYARTDTMVPLIVAIGNGDSEDNPDTNWIRTSAGSDTLSTATFRYNSVTGSSGKLGAIGVYRSPVANITIDTSRYSNFNQIPNLTVGFNFTDKENAGETYWYVSDYTSGDMNYMKDFSQIDSRNNVNNNASNYYDKTGATPFAGSISGQTGVNNGAEYNGTWNRAVTTSGASNNYILKTGAYTYRSYLTGKGAAYSVNYIQVKGTNVDKAALRKLVLEGATLNENNFTSASWNTYKTALRNAALALGNPTNSTIDTTTLTNAKNNLKYKIVFDNLVDFSEWDKTSASNATISNVTNGGFTLTSNDGAGEGTSSSPFFPVTPGKQYRIDIDYEGTAWDVYIFFCDTNGTWVDFADGPTNRVSYGATTGVPVENAVFTAPNKDSVVKAQIRVDANGASNTVKFSNIRVYEVGAVEDGVSYETTKAVTYNTTIGTLPTPTRDGYTFLGWYTADGTQVKDTDTAKDGITYVTSKWEAKKYTVTWVAGDTTTTETYTHGATPSYKNGTPTKADDDKYTYTFTGWDKTFSPVTGDITYTAQFSAESKGYTITWENWDGTVLETDTSVTPGTTPKYDGDEPTKTGDAQFSYTFTGWSPAVGAATSDKTYTAQFSQTTNQYKVTWKNWDGTVLKTETLKYGSTPTPPANPTRADTDQFTYTFTGWGDVVSVTGDATYTAQFSSTTRTYNIVWVNDNGDVLETDVNVSYGTMPKYDGETPTKASTAEFNYTFAGWGDVLAVTGNATYTATYTSEKRSYTITWKNDDGSVIDTTTVPYGEVPTHADATKANTAEYTYTFAGWDTTPVAVTGDATYKATFNSTKNSYTITWLNDNDSVIDTTTVEYGVVPTHAAPTKAADAQYTYTFASWTPEVVAVTGNATYKATYTSTVNKYTIIFKNEDGTVLQSGKVAYGETPVYEGAEPTKTATAQYSYAFIGWDSDIAKVTGDATYTAQFEESTNVYKVTWLDGNGDVLGISNVPYGETPVYTGETPTKAETDQYTYTFNGKWTPEIDKVTGDATYTAQFDSTVNKYTITWNNADGTLLGTSEVAYGEVPVYEGATPTKESTPKYSYTFKDWGTVVAVTGPATYVAQYTETLRSYTVTWVNTDGTVLETDENVLYGTMPEYNGATPSKAKDAQYTYSFDKWSPDVAAVEGDATYTAVYSTTVNTYDIVWKNENGTVLETDVDVDYGTTPTYNGATPTKASTAEYTYTFAGWTPEVDTVKGDAEYTATFTPVKRSYTITWQNEDGTTIDTTTVEYGVVPTHVDATKANTAEYTYTFAGWDNEVVAVTGDATYKATFTATKNSYTITWKNDDGTTIDTTTVEYGVVPTHADATKANTAEYTYTFAGWDPKVVAVTGDATYTAKFNATKNSYTITWLNDDGTTIDTTTVEYGVVPTHADATKANTAEYTYTFAGWTPDVVAVTGDATYKATFTAEKNSYTITWLNDDGTTIDTTTVEYGVVPKHADATKAETAEYKYKFASWTPEVVAVTGDATYKATFTAIPQEYTITWLADGEDIFTETLAYGDKIEKIPAVPQKTGFVGVWGEYPSTMPPSNITIYAIYSENVITVTWKVEGQPDLTTAVEYGTKVSYTGEKPVKESTVDKVYTFAGWAETENGTVIADNEFPVSSATLGNKVYYAVFTESDREYTITWVTEGKEPVIVTEKYTYGATPVYKGETPTKAETDKYTYTFAGWGNVVPVTSDATYTAQFDSTVKTYQITWIVNGTPYIANVAYDETPVYPNGTPTKDADAQYTYTFTGWSPAVETVTGNATYVADFSATVNTYTVTWVIDGVETTETYEYGATPSHEDPVKAADAQYTYTFTGWTPAIETVTGNARYEAQFDSTVNEYTVTWDIDGEKTTETYEYGAKPEYKGATPERDATAQYTYTFAKWVGLADDTIVTGDVTFKADFSSTVNEYTITFQNEDGTELQSGKVAYGETPAYTGETPVKAGNAQYSYKFSGWTPAIAEVTGDAVYTAVFAEKTNTYTVIWNNEDGTNLEKDESVPYGTMPVYNGATPTKAATAQYTYTFAGWDAEISTVTGDVTYTATFTSKVNEYTITWKNDDGSVIDTTTVAYGTVPTHADATKDNTAQYTYTFAGWTPEVVAVTGEATYTATYSSTVNEYTVTFKNEDGTELQSGKLAYGATPVYTGETPTKEGDAQYTYTFAGWDAEISTVTGDVTYTATFAVTVNEYAITWLNEDGSVIDTTYVAYGEVPTHAAPVKAATAEYTYTFAGWGDVVAVTGEATYQATFTATKNSYTITWDINGTKTTDTYEYGAKPEFKGSTDITEIGATYEFLGWDKEITTVTGNETYIAQYKVTIIAYEITWVDGNGDIIYSEDVQFGKTPVYDAEKYDTPKKDDSTTEVYTFAGKWSPAVSKVTGAATYTAEFTSAPRTYTVTWYIEGEFFKTADLKYGDTIPVYSIPADKEIEGYTLNWDTTHVTMPAEDIEIKTKPTPKKYPVFWIVNNNTVHAESVEYGSAIPSWTVPTMEGFTGKWVGVPETMPAHSIEIYAEYSPIKYTVMWRINGVQKTDVAVYGTEYVLKLNEEEGYPEDVRITVGGAVLSEDLYNYDYTTGTIVIAASAVKGNINIVEKASGNVVNVISSIYGGTSTNKKDTTALRRAYHTTIVPNNGYVLPEEIAIYIDGLYVASGYTYNAETGKLTINAEVIVGEVEIYAECVHKSVIEDPDRPDDPSNCNCNCHSANAFLKFFFNIANFFRKLFGMTQYKYCACNAAHW